MVGALGLDAWSLILRPSRVILGGKDIIGVRWWWAGLDSPEGGGAGVADGGVLDEDERAKLANEGTRDLSSTTIATGVPTGMSLLPSGISSLAMKPSSWFSNIRVALSVSMSANASPALTSVPSFTCHLTMLPLSIVGDNDGMVSLM